MDNNIIEIFSSVQGEGKYVGCRQVFVRFEGCNLNCRYCDTENRPNGHAYCMFEKSAGSRSFEEVPNPLTEDVAVEKIRKLLEAAPHHSVSFTGGEPLLHGEFIRRISEKLDVPVFLETNGTWPEKLEEIIDCVDIISMDIKLPSVVGQELWEVHRRFLETASKRDCYVKMVISEETTDEEFRHAVDMLAGFSKDMLLILQPVTPFGGCKAAAPERMLEVQAYALRYLKDVRVIPQTHRMMGQL